MSNPESKGLNGDIASSPLTEKEKIAWQTRRWKNRRRMAWCSVLALIAIILLFFFAPIPESRLAIIVEPISMMAFVFGGVIGAYMGFTTIEKMKMGK
jgi:uncharacterized membrane protein YhaH (DUF805 family)